MLPTKYVRSAGEGVCACAYEMLTWGIIMMKTLEIRGTYAYAAKVDREREHRNRMHRIERIDILSLFCDRMSVCVQGEGGRGLCVRFAY